MEISKIKLDMCMATNCMSINDLSAKSGIPRATISSVVNQKRNPKPATIGKIARALNVSVAELIEQ